METATNQPKQEEFNETARRALAGQLREGLADLYLAGQVRGNHADTQHRINLAIYSIRKVLAALDPDGGK